MPDNLLGKTLHHVKNFAIAPFETSEMDPNYLRGVWMPFMINWMTKGASKPIEQQAGLSTTHMTHAGILLTLSNVYIKAQSMSLILQTKRSLPLKASCFLLICGYDAAVNYLLAKQDFRNNFPQPSHEVENESWIFLGLLNLAYLIFASIRHYQEYKQQTNLAEQFTSPTEEANHNLPAEKQHVTLKTAVNQLQLPLKFLLGVSAFFYGIMAGEAADWRLQLPLSAAFYGTAMALTQVACNLLKQEKNWALVLYALACGPAEGVAYYSTLNWLPEDMHTILKAIIVATTTSTSVLFAGNLMFAFLNANGQNTLDSVAATDDSSTPTHTEYNELTSPMSP